MLYLESYAHRVQLAEIVSRWIVNRPRPGDVALLKAIINFNSYAATLWLDWFTSDLLTRIHGETPRSFVCNTKGVLKDYLVDHCTEHSSLCAVRSSRCPSMRQGFFPAIRAESTVKWEDG